MIVTHASGTQTDTPDPTAPPVWIRSAGWDGFWMLSGFWIPLLLLLLPLQGASALIVALTLCFWIAHRLSSLYLAWCVGEYREVLRARPGYFFGLPLLLLVAVMAFVLPSESLLPIPRLYRFLILGFCDYFFSLWHFSVQHYGVLAVYRSRLPHGQSQPWLLRWDFWLCLGVSGIFTVVMDAVNGELTQFHHFFGPVAWNHEPGPELRLGLTALVGIAWLATLRHYLRWRQGLARMLYVSTLCLMTVISFYVSPLLYFSIVQIQHWFVSLGLTTHMAAGSRYTGPGRWYRAWGRINARVLGPLLVLVLLSLLLTPVLEADYYILQQMNSEVLVVKYFLERFRDSAWLSFFGGLAFFSSFLHYVYDRGVFRFSDPLTRKAALGLLQRRG